MRLFTMHQVSCHAARLVPGIYRKVPETWSPNGKDRLTEEGHSFASEMTVKKYRLVAMKQPEEKDALYNNE